MKSDNYKWIALSNTTLGILMAVINQSIVIIALPAIFRGIHLNPLIPSNTSYLLWMLLGFMVVMAVLVVSLGRVGDMFGGCGCTTSASRSSPPARSCCR
jgi:MFS family permease